MRNRKAQLVHGLSGALLVALVFFYFLLFAQFAFLHLLEIRVGSGRAGAFLGIMGIAGVAGSLLAGLHFHWFPPRLWLAAGFAGAGIAGCAVLFPVPSPVLYTASGGIGLFLGILTTSLVGYLKRTVPASHAGLVCGAGTGIAYALSNVPFLFTASPSLQTACAVLACLAGIGVILFFGEPLSVRHPLPGGPVSSSAHYALLGVVILFLVLVWTDSAAFRLLQEIPGLKASTWSGSGQLLAIGLVHFLAALWGGLWLDRGRLWHIGILAFAGLCGGYLLIEGTGWNLAGLLIYVSAVSLYSTALIGFSLKSSSPLPVTLQAGWVFAVAGWIGSGMGIGMADHLGSVPRLFWLVAALTFAGGAFLHTARGRKEA